jgi:hypothetical protein
MENSMKDGAQGEQISGTRDLGVLVFEISYDSDESIVAAMTAAADLCREKRFILEAFRSDRVLVTCWADEGLAAEVEVNRLSELAAALLQAFGAHIRVAYGPTRGIYGVHGAKLHLNFGWLIPAMSDIMEQLRGADFGQVAILTDHGS